jgi:hypothetical protein
MSSSPASCNSRTASVEPRGKGNLFPKRSWQPNSTLCPAQPRPRGSPDRRALTGPSPEVRASVPSHCGESCREGRSVLFDIAVFDAPVIDVPSLFVRMHRPDELSRYGAENAVMPVTPSCRSHSRNRLPIPWGAPCVLEKAGTFVGNPLFGKALPQARLCRRRFIARPPGAVRPDRGTDI